MESSDYILKNYIATVKGLHWKSIVKMGHA